MKLGVIHKNSDKISAFLGPKFYSFLLKISTYYNPDYQVVIVESVIVKLRIIYMYMLIVKNFISSDNSCGQNNKIKFTENVKEIKLVSDFFSIM